MRHGLWSPCSQSKAFQTAPPAFRTPSQPSITPVVRHTSAPPGQRITTNTCLPPLDDRTLTGKHALWHMSSRGPCMPLTLLSEAQGCQRCGALPRRLALPVLASALPAAPAAAAPAPRAMKRTYSSLWTGEDLAEDYGDSTAGAPKDRRAGALRLTHHMRCLPSDACSAFAAYRAYRDCKLSIHPSGPTASTVSCPAFGVARRHLLHRRHHPPDLPAGALWNGRDRLRSIRACGLDGIRSLCLWQVKICAPSRSQVQLPLFLPHDCCRCVPPYNHVAGYRLSPKFLMNACKAVSSTL